MDSLTFLNILFISLGLLSVIAAFLNWEWMFKKQKRAGFILMLDRNGARVFNFILGVLMLLIGSFDKIFPLIR